MAYCFICGDLCDAASMKTVQGIKIEMVTKAGWMPSRIPRRLAGPNPRNWWQDTVNQSISSNWSLCGPCSAEFDGAQSGKRAAPAPPDPPPARPSSPAPTPTPVAEEKPASTPSANPGVRIALPLDSSAPPAASAPASSPALTAIKRWQLLALSPGSLGIMIAIVMFATAEDGVPFSFLLVPLSLVAIAVLAVLILEGRKVQIGRAAREEQLWSGFFQNTFQAWRGGLLDELAVWYRTTPSNYQGVPDFVSNNIEIRAFRKIGLWFQPQEGEFLVEVDNRGRGRPAFVLTNLRGIVQAPGEGWLGFSWSSVRKISTVRNPKGAELVLGSSEGEQTLSLAVAPSDKALDFLVKKQGLSMSGVRPPETTERPRSLEEIIDSAASATALEMEWLVTQGPAALEAILAVSDRLRGGEWALAENMARLAIPLADLGGEDARKLLTTLVQLPDPTREAEIVRDGAARGLERLRSRG